MTDVSNIDDEKSQKFVFHSAYQSQDDGAGSLFLPTQINNSHDDSQSSRFACLIGN
jgi:hypothetical protein